MSDISTFESFLAPRGHEPFPVPWSSVRERFESVATAVPDNIAVVCRGSSLSYRELHSLADAHARALVGHLGSDRRPVALDTTCSLDCVVALVSVLLSGHPLVLLDSQLPEDRRHNILTRSGAARISPAELAALPRHPEQPLPAVSESDCAVLLFTSGSTGTPKAVRQGHRLWLNQAADFHATLGIGSGDRLGMALPISFGGGLDVVFSALLNGGELHFLDPREVGIEEVPQWISSHMLTTLHATPSLLRAVMKVCAGTATLTGLRLVTTCGEAVHGDDVARLRTLLSPTASYCNLSGSSETGNLAFNEFPPGRDVPDRVLPVGVVAANKVVRLLGPDGADVAPGEVGEIVVESPYLSEGYFVERDGTATAEITKFGRAADGTRSFRMGDLGRFDQHGLLHLVGRSDDAVKVRGYLVEPSEVESALRRLPAVEDAIVLARQTDSGAVLVGYVAVDPATRAPSAADLRRDLRKTLPDWMIPANLMLLPALPRNERGKVDRGALPAPSPRPAVIPPAVGVESELAALWSEILGIEQIGRDDDFVSLGGDSLQTQQMLTRAGQKFGAELSSATLANFPTLHQFSAHLEQAATGTTLRTRVLVPLQTGGTGDPLFAFAGAGSTALALLPLARELGPQWTVHGLQAYGLEGRGFPDWTVRSAAKRYLREIRQVQPHGPYTFVGHSLGGVIAMDVARLLEAEGETVNAVICLDTILSGPLGSGILDLSRSEPDSGEQSIPLSEPAPTDRRTLWKTRAMLLTAGLWQYPAQTQWDLFHDLGRRVALMHRLRPWDGAVSVVMAEDNPDDPAWWTRVAPHVVSVERVSGDHVGMLRPPYVAHTAALVREALK
ncbi:non-ribosomal peptide synthetase [Rhodococcus globerulus]|uniref:non-ribosomal peptide synthetase n=1 Tax=Rhodococcus globerulus TaxID=33008 RepID=UPI003019670B